MGFAFEGAVVNVVGVDIAGVELDCATEGAGPEGSTICSACDCGTWLSPFFAVCPVWSFPFPSMSPVRFKRAGSPGKLESNCNKTMQNERKRLALSAMRARLERHAMRADGGTGNKQKSWPDSRQKFQENAQGRQRDKRESWTRCQLTCPHMNGDCTASLGSWLWGHMQSEHGGLPGQIVNLILETLISDKRR